MKFEVGKKYLVLEDWDQLLKKGDIVECTEADGDSVKIGGWYTGTDNKYFSEQPLIGTEEVGAIKAATSISELVALSSGGFSADDICKLSKENLI